MTVLRMKSGRPKCQNLFECYRKLEFILDDESYFTLSTLNWAWNDRFYSQGKENATLHVRNNFQNKLEQEILFRS